MFGWVGGGRGEKLRLWVGADEGEAVGSKSFGGTSNKETEKCFCSRVSGVKKKTF